MSPFYVFTSLNFHCYLLLLLQVIFVISFLNVFELICFNEENTIIIGRVLNYIRTLALIWGSRKFKYILENYICIKQTITSTSPSLYGDKLTLLADLIVILGWQLGNLVGFDWLRAMQLSLIVKL